MLSIGLKDTRQWNKRDQALVRAVGRGLQLALERAEQTRQLDEERAALAAFARFTETSTQVTDVLTLARLASALLRATLNAELAYSELEDGCWKGRGFSEETPAAVVAQAREGFPADLPSFARPFKERGAVFIDGWNASEEGAETTEVYRAAALYPYFRGGKPHGLLTMGSAAAGAWTERERSIFLAVARSLELAFERAEQTARLAAQNAELDARTRALSAFVDLTRDLSLHSEPQALIRRALEVALSLLPPGFGLFHELQGSS